MIDKWFVGDVEKVLSQRYNRLVITDAQNEGSFLLKYLPERCVLLKVLADNDDSSKNDLLEIKARYKAEQEHAQDIVVFYTNRSKSELTFLLEYAETNGCIVLDDMENYIKGHLFAATNENTELSKQELLMAAKLSEGKDQKWWEGVSKRIINPLDTESLLIDLLGNPAETKQKMDESMWNMFAAKVYKLIKKPQTEQSAEIMARTVMDVIFTGLLGNSLSKSLLDIYYKCTNNTSMRERLMQYIQDYTIPEDASPLTVHPDHPFTELDKRLFRMLSETLEERASTSQYLDAINQRTISKKALDYKSKWLKEIKILLEFKHSDLHKITELKNFTNYYQKKFSKLDTAIRHLYAEWFNDEKLLRPYQYLYEQQEKELLNKWFDLIDQYQPDQQAIVEKELNGSERTAVIVCDGLRLEIAEAISMQIETKKNLNMAMAMLPSVTENGMSALFGCQDVETDPQMRRQQLESQVSDVQVIQLEKLNNSVQTKKLVLLFGDIDQVGEKKQLAALKDISAYEAYLSNKIAELHQMGYTKVVLTTDHGFVITGILDEADKVIAPEGVEKVEERFCLGHESIGRGNMIERQTMFRGYEFQYYAKTDKPFRTKGAYGYAHGGFTPQECIIPVYEFLRKSTIDKLKVNITNKEILKKVTGQHFVVKLRADANKNRQLFLQNREVLVRLYEGDKLLKESQIMKMNAEDMQELKYEMPASGKAMIIIIDADDKSTIDFCEVAKNDVRDLGGLL